MMVYRSLLSPFIFFPWPTHFFCFKTEASANESQGFSARARGAAGAGLPIWGVTVQNEPIAVQRWESCFFSAEAERDFVRDHLGPTFEQSGLKEKRIIVWGHRTAAAHPKQTIF